MDHTSGMESRLLEEVFQKAGGRQLLRGALGLSKQTMSDWARLGYVPARHAVAVEKITGIKRERLCPHFDWGEQPSSPTAPAQHTPLAGARSPTNHPGERAGDKTARAD